MFGKFQILIVFDTSRTFYFKNGELAIVITKYK